MNSWGIFSASSPGTGCSLPSNDVVLVDAAARPLRPVNPHLPFAMVVCVTGLLLGAVGWTLKSTAALSPDAGV